MSQGSSEVPAFEYEITEGVQRMWLLTLTGYSSEVDGDFDPVDSLLEVEHLLSDLQEDYAGEAGAEVTRVRGGHGWREFEWSDGAVHHFQWEFGELDLRCAICKSSHADLFMVRDEVWESSGLDGWVCFRCLERAIGRQLTPADFDPDIPANTDECHREPELRQRMGLA